MIKCCKGTFLGCSICRPFPLGFPGHSLVSTEGVCSQVALSNVALGKVVAAPDSSVIKGKQKTVVTHLSARLSVLTVLIHSRVII